MSTEEVNQRIRTGRKLAIKRAVQDLINVYKDRWDYVIRDELVTQLTLETFNKYQFLITKELNLLKRVVNDISVVYKDAPERSAVTATQETDEEDNTITNVTKDENYELSQQDTNKDFALQAINKYTNLTNNTLLKITYRDKKLDYDVLNFNNAEVYTSKDDWMKMVAVKHYFGLKIGDNEDLVGRSNTNIPSQNYDENIYGIPVGQVQDYTMAKLWVIEDINREGVVEDGGDGVIKGGFVYTIENTGNGENIVKKERIPYLDDEGNPILPFVLFTKEYPIDELLDFSTGNDLWDLNVSVAILLVFLNSIEKYQSFKQVVFNTDDPSSIPDDIKLGPSDILVNPTKEGGGSVEVLDLQAKTQEKYDLIKQRIMTTLSTYNISPENFTMSASPQSGFSLKISNIGKIESRQAQIPMYRVKEKEVFGIEKIIWNFHMPSNRINDKSEFVIDFAELEFPKSPEEKIQEFSFLKANNAKTEIDLVMSLNPDLTREEAEQEWRENKAFNEANKPIVNIQPAQQPADEEEEEEEEVEAQ